MRQVSTIIVLAATAAALAGGAQTASSGAFKLRGTVTYVVDGDTVVGIVSERDVVRRLNDRGAAILDATVADIMTSPVLSCSSQDSVEGVATTMTERRIRHMPVIDDGTLEGIVTIGDVVLSRTRQLEQDRHQLEQYITG
jgi:CBS domain-containing protein